MGSKITSKAQVLDDGKPIEFSFYPEDLDSKDYIETKTVDGVTYEFSAWCSKGKCYTSCFVISGDTRKKLSSIKVSEA